MNVYKYTTKNYYWIILISLFIQSCYSYGPVHKPYEYHKKTKEYKENYMQKTYNAIQTEIPIAEVTLVQDSIKILFPDYIKYQSNEVVPASTYKEALVSLSKLLLNHSETNLLAVGYTDNNGTVSYNKKLSNKRAEFIKNYLVFLGMMETKIETWGLGSQNPIGDNSTEEGKLKNRRVEFIVLYDDGIH